LFSPMRARFSTSAYRKSFSLLMLAAMPALALPGLASAGPWMVAPGEHYSTLGGSFFTSDSYYDSDGNRWALKGGGLHEEKAIVAYNEFGWKKGRSFILGLPLVNVSRRFGAAGADSGRNETGFGDLLVGVKFKLKGGAQAMSVEADWLPPLGYNRNLSPRLGDGAASLIGKLAYGSPLGHSGFMEFEGGYRYYTEKQAPTNEALASGTVAFWFGHSVLVSGRYDGTFGASSADTLYRSLYVKTPQGQPWSNSEARPFTTTDQVVIQTVSPMVLYRVDDHIDLMAGTSHTFSAKNALHVDRVYVAIALRQTKLGPLQGFMGGRP
jgi:hypothetical protein